MIGGTKGGAQRASSLRPRCVGEVDPKTMTHINQSINQSICLSIYLSIYGIFTARLTLEWSGSVTSSKNIDFTNSTLTGFHKIIYWRLLQNPLKKIHLCLKSDKNIRTFTRKS
jgi:hypothetical protein